jgi:hypothetical protein
LRNDLASNPGNVDAEKVSSKAAVLQQAWKNETFRELKTEIAAQWMDLPGMMNVASVNTEWQSPGNGSIKASSTETFMLNQISHSEFASVRRVFYEKLPAQAKYREVLLNGLTDSSYNNVEFVINKLWQSPEFYADRSTILESIKSENGHLHNIKIKYLECAYEHAMQKSANGEPKSAENDPQMYVNLLKDMAGPYHEFRTRTQAMSALKRLNYLDVELAHNLFDGVLNFNSRLSQPATELINHFKQNSAYKQLLFSALAANASTETNSTSNWTKTYTKSDQARLLKVIR